MLAGSVVSHDLGSRVNLAKGMEGQGAMVEGFQFQHRSTDSFLILSKRASARCGPSQMWDLS